MSKKKPAKKLSQLKTSVFSRSLSMAKLSLNAGVKYASSKLTQTPFEEFLTSQAVTMTKEFGELKGSLMKVGQMLSMYGEYFFPPAANQLLKSLQTDSPAVEWNVMQETLAKYLPDELIAELEIDPEPIGCASLGQVHKARVIETGELIAIKIQYPDVDKAIDSDIAALKRILKVTKVLPQNLDLDPVFNEVKTMLLQELDYKKEAELTELYAEKIKGDDRFIVPRVIRRYSSGKVLTTSFVEGFKPDHPLVLAINQKRKNRLSENFLELYLKEIFEWNLVQTDPHLGNYKIQIDPMGKDKIVLLDFGACRIFSDEFITSYRKFVKGAVLGDEKLFFNGARGLGFVIDSDSPEYLKTFKSFCYETVEPFWTYEDPRNTQQKIKPDGTYHWKETDLPGRIVKKAIEFKKFDLRSPPQQIIFLDRKTGGVFIFLSVFHAEINARKIIEPFLTRV